MGCTYVSEPAPCIIGWLEKNILGLVIGHHCYCAYSASMTIYALCIPLGIETPPQDDRCCGS